MKGAEDAARADKQPGIVLLGSCVTRDSIEYRDLRRHLTYFHARSNLASMAFRQPCVSVPPFNLGGNFENRCAMEDFSKTIRLRHRGELVLFDFMDDRMPIGQMDGGLFTYNMRVVNAAAPGAFEGTKVTRHYRPAHRPLVRKIVERFYRKNEALFHQNRIVVHHAKFNPHYDGRLSPATTLTMMNDHFDFLMDEIMRVWKVDRLIDITAMLDGPHATPADHRWGHKPFHYTTAYQERLADLIAQAAHEWLGAGTDPRVEPAKHGCVPA